MIIVFGAILIGLAAVGVYSTNQISTPPPVVPTAVPAAPTRVIAAADSAETSQKQGLFVLQTPTPTPTTFVPPTVPEGPSLCSAANLAFDDEGASNSESNIFIALDPPNGQPVGASGMIRAWVSDEAGGGLAQSTIVETTGYVSGHSDPLIDKDPNGYPWEPAIYITKIIDPNQAGPFSGDKESGGTPHFLTMVRGKVTKADNGPWVSVPQHSDPLPYKIGTRVGDGEHVAEFIWHVSSLGLAPGTYRVQVAVHDGDEHLAVECTTVTI